MEENNFSLNYLVNVKKDFNTDGLTPDYFFNPVKSSKDESENEDTLKLPRIIFNTLYLLNNNLPHVPAILLVKLTCYPV